MIAMSFYTHDVIKKQIPETFNKTSSNTYSVLNDPAYRDRYREKFLEAQKKGMDMVVYYDGTIALIENKIAMYQYGWHKKRREFERIKFASETKKKRG
ncbi:Hypothetical protein ERGA_CDS_03410 [Ehrlichia ruminantium str. Gardel]|uniref:Uncharacterized protein n=2 Tax=Ehrlichia ruminantium TaxID=779 RepID=A0A0H3M846_EHRRW|nr:Hypothetical protein ERWE_CDS_03450 [Ehrlichia ruminantium str. Welgevonden]CAI27793.1 Hypothetical protein ERGA_CDS_03410 [Ehrlichia ruminantium str. Gardel]